jgi:hypothetical protein
MGKAVISAVTLFLAAIAGLGLAHYENSRHLDAYTSHLGGRVPCDVPNRELVFGRALNKACSKLSPGHESKCMAALITEVVKESDADCKPARTERPDPSARESSGLQAELAAKPVQ